MSAFVDPQFFIAPTVRDPGDYTFQFSPGVGAIPEPGALPLFAAGLGAMGLFSWRRKRKAAT